MMEPYIVLFTDNTTAIITAYSTAAAYEWAQEMYGKAIASVSRSKADSPYS